MQSYDRVTSYGDWYSHTYGNLTSSGQNPIERVIMTVTNGLVAGDKKTPNPITFTRTTYRPSHGTIRATVTQSGAWHQNTTSGHYTADLPSYNLELAPNWGQVQDECMEKIYEAIRGTNNLVVDLAESSATLRMLRSTINLRKAATTFFNEVVKGRGYRKSRGQARLDYVTSKWLEYRYGWSPLVGSIYDALDTLANKVVVDPNVYKKARASAVLSDKYLSGRGTWSSPQVREDHEISFRCETKIHFWLPPGLQIYDWTSLNPARIAWELMPLSFVADWVLNVSQQLTLWENYWLFNSAFRSGYTTLSYRKRSSQVVSGGSSVPVDYYPSGDPMDGTWSQSLRVQNSRTETFKDRAKLHDLPRPGGFRVELQLGSKRQLDAAALLHQLFAKKLRF